MSSDKTNSTVCVNPRTATSLYSLTRCCTVALAIELTASPSVWITRSKLTSSNTVTSAHTSQNKAPDCNSVMHLLSELQPIAKQPAMFSYLIKLHGSNRQNIPSIIEVVGSPTLSLYDFNVKMPRRFNPQNNDSLSWEWDELYCRQVAFTHESSIRSIWTLILKVTRIDYRVKYCELVAAVLLTLATQRLSAG